IVGLSIEEFGEPVEVDVRRYLERTGHVDRAVWDITGVAAFGRLPGAELDAALVLVDLLRGHQIRGERSKCGDRLESRAGRIEATDCPVEIRVLRLFAPE